MNWNEWSCTRTVSKFRNPHSIVNNVTRRKLRPMYQWYSSSVASAEAQSRKNWTAWLEGRWEDHVTRACTNCWTPFAVPFQCSCGGTTTVISNHHCCSTTYCVYNSTISFKVKYIKGMWLLYRTLVDLVPGYDAGAADSCLVLLCDGVQQTNGLRSRHSYGLLCLDYGCDGSLLYWRLYRRRPGKCVCILCTVLGVEGWGKLLGGRGGPAGLNPQEFLLTANFGTLRILAKGVSAKY